MKNKEHNREIAREIAVVDKQNQKCLVVSVRHVATPDDKERVSRAISILLKAATKDTSNHRGRAQRP